MSELQFQIQGRNAEIIAQKVSTILAKELKVQPELSSPNRPIEKDRRAVDPVALAALIVSIPSAVLAALDVLDRMKKKGKIEKALEKIGELMQDFPDAAIQLKAPDGTLLKVEKSNATKLIDAANKENK
jgi:hypothetical protein